MTLPLSPGAVRRGGEPGLPARPGRQRRVCVPSRGYDRNRGTVPPCCRGQRTPRSRLAGGGGHLRRPLNIVGSVGAVDAAPASANGQPLWREPAATSPTSPSSSALPRAVTCLSATPPGRSRWLLKRLAVQHTPARQSHSKSGRPPSSSYGFFVRGRTVIVEPGAATLVGAPGGGRRESKEGTPPPREGGVR